MIKEFMKRAFVSIILIIAATACFRVGFAENAIKYDSVYAFVGIVLMFRAFFYLNKQLFDTATKMEIKLKNKINIIKEKIKW
ncbi:hypothetical protein [Aliarcobacter butzleri]|uniref:hypothetical protein n=1 Tax=Aliarcobacter butzleri TaxID=28197 RepID=UPI002B253CE6|nr:hypothetical protein [Aliarcobacter butzleri]